MELQSSGYFLFLGLVAIAHSLVSYRWRVALLLGASLFFYGFSRPAGLMLLLALSGLNYLAALRLSREASDARRPWIFGAIMALDLAVLFAFKYFNELWQLVPSSTHGGPLDFAIKLTAPVGISYFTFQMVSCITDAYRRDWKMEGGPARFMLFGVFFPQITSGPIPRAPLLLPQLAASVTPTEEDRLAGLRLIAYGLFKKWVVANRLSDYVAQVFDVAPGVIPNHFSLLPTLVACLFNALNLYADFSGYVDIARGSARLLGIRLDLNFDRPMISTSVTEFWRRWHMTLSFWLRDYLYMPLLIRIRNLGMTGVISALIFTFAICGLWHDATWPYLLFGVAQGVAMSLELLTKRWRSRRFKKWSPRVIDLAGWIYTMGFFCLSEVLFRSARLTDAARVYGGLQAVHRPHGAAELFAFRGPYDFALDLLAVALWAIIARCMRGEKSVSTPAFVFMCVLLVLFFGRLATGHFIYAGF